MTAGEPGPRPEVVQAVFSALIDMDPDRLTALQESGISVTPAERTQAEELYLSSMLASRDQRERWLESMQVLIGDRKFSEPPSWAELFDGLSPERVAELRELYDAMPDPARAEYDRRYGRPSQAAEEREVYGDSPGEDAMSEQDAARWASARTIAEIGELTAQWLEGKIASVPGTVPGCGPDEETAELIPVLAACNRAGFVTIVSQPGEEPAVGYNGRLWTQRAAVEGFASTDALEALRSCTAGTRLIFMAVPADRPGHNWETQIPVTLDGDEENTWFGSQMARSDIEDTQAGYGICHPSAVEALCAAWQVTLIDPEWGRNDVLWPALQKFAER